MKQVFIDGSAGTTGLRIKERLKARTDVALIELKDEDRKNEALRKEAMNDADAVFLCLPDDAAQQAVQMVENENTIVLDASTAHRTLPGWVYGLPQLSGAQKKAIQTAKRIAVPGCHACGFIVLTAPLVKAGVVDAQTVLSCTSLTGYSGGGKSMIAEYESQQRSPLLSAPRMYGLTQQHKHLKEMCAVTGLSRAPVFLPIVGDFYSGMQVTVPLPESQCKASRAQIEEIYRSAYDDAVIRWDAHMEQDGFLSALTLSGRDDMRVGLMGTDERLIAVAQYDNLGKGASGAAIECMNLALGLSDYEGLILE
ncbi:MAG TPA: N-acetyl-gamma-glutamyl-phosphate reductase [Candidatus Ruthenibacterium merdavium]|uniref:N-acetyl-gamma-glutamyl-phosphate reductase n=1 Tax=Candidatus Ruthenibacterium merdavium TaxID=2838752 RepID=A0A9D2Q3V9_9FIRM|nr:N-acetyl-gamma-glutamyl-phosphate reductase [Candidatus Ruthenibacterium merdavium]